MFNREHLLIMQQKCTDLCKLPNINSILTTEQTNLTLTKPKCMNFYFRRKKNFFVQVL